MCVCEIVVYIKRKWNISWVEGLKQIRFPLQEVLCGFNLPTRSIFYQMHPAQNR